MKKRTLWAFAIGFSAPFLLATGLLYVESDSFKMLAPGVVTQSLILTAVISSVIALSIAFSEMTQGYSPEQDDFQLGISQEAGVAFRTLWILRKPAFAPMWLVSATLGLGLFFIFSQYPIPGSLLLLVGQATWFASRRRLRQYIDWAPLDNHLCIYLVGSLRLMDALALVSITVALGSLGTYGEIVDSLPLMGLSALLAAVYFGIQASREKEFSITDYLIKTTAGFIWISMLATAVNFAFDFNKPLMVKRLAYLPCQAYREEVLSRKIAPRPEMLDCHYFSRLNDPRTDSEIELVYHPGALGAEWKKSRVVR